MVLGPAPPTVARLSASTGLLDTGGRWYKIVWRKRAEQGQVFNEKGPILRNLLSGGRKKYLNAESVQLF